MEKKTTKPSRARERMLVERARDGDRLALREIIDLHKDRLYAFIWRMVRDHHEAEDVCQDAFLKAFASLNSFSTEYRFSTWLFTIGYRVCLNRLRRQKPIDADLDLAAFSAQTDDSSSALIESEEAAKLRSSVWAAVEELTPPQRASIVLFYRHEFSCQEIARVVQLPLATVKSHLHRARARLRSLLLPVMQKDSEMLRNLAQRAG